MPTMSKPVYGDAALKGLLPMGDDRAVDVNNVPVSPASGNVLTKDAAGLLVTPESLVSSGADNIITVQDGKLYASVPEPEPVDPASLVSEAADNLITVRDGKLYAATPEQEPVSPDTLVSDAEDNQLKVQDGKLYVGETTVVSRDLNNVVTEGSDGGAYLDRATMESVVTDFVDDRIDAKLPDVVVVSADENNLLRRGTDSGAYLDQPMIEGVISGVVDEKVTEEMDNLKVVSTDGGNLMRAGTDGLAYINGNDILSNGDVNLITTNAVDGRLILTRENVLAHLTIVSNDEGNLIETGSDGGVYFGIEDLVSEDDKVLDLDGHGQLVAELDLSYNTTTGELRLLGKDGEEVGNAIVPTSTSALRSVEFTRSKPDADGEAVEGDYFVSLAFKFDANDAYEGGDGLVFTTTKGTAATQNVDYTMNTTVGANVYPDKVKAVFLGQMVEQDIEFGTPNTITFPDGSRLVLTWNSSTGTVINFQAAFTPAIGVDLGSFLRMAWLLADGSVMDVYVEMTNLYTAGNGIHIDDTGLITVVVDPVGGLQNTGAGVGVKVDPDGGLQTNGDGTSIKIDPDGGLQTNTDGASIKVDPQGGLETTEDGTSVKIDPEGGLQTDGDGTSIKTDPSSGLVTGPDGTGIDDQWLDDQITDQIRNTDLITAGNGIDVTTTETGKQVSVVGSDSIDSEADGVSVNEDWLAQQITDKVKEDTSLITADDSINVTPTDTGVNVAVDPDWLDEQITEQIRNDNTLLVKGNGITLTTTTTGKEIAADAGTGITVNVNGINVNETWLNNRITDKVKGDTSLITADDSINVTPTDTGVQAAVNEDWLADQITEQVRTDTGLIQAGHGITINVTSTGKTISADAGTGIVSDTNGISIDTEWLADQGCSMISETDGNQIVCDNGKLFVYSDYGTMD